MASEPEMRHDKITLPERMSTTQAHALAMQKAHAKAGKGNKVPDLQLGDSIAVGGNQGTDVEWSFSYQVVLAEPGAQAKARWRCSS